MVIRGEIEIKTKGISITLQDVLKGLLNKNPKKRMSIEEFLDS